MFIKNLTVRQVDKNDPRYPEKDCMKRGDGSWVPFLEVYLCEVTIDGGEKFEAPVFVTENMDFEFAGNMLQQMAAAVSRMAIEKAA